MLLPGWKRRVRASVGNMHMISYDDVTSYQDVGKVIMPTRSFAVTSGGITLQIDHLQLSSAVEAELFARMVVGSWVDVAELRAKEINDRTDDDALMFRRAFVEGYRSALRFTGTRVRRFGEQVATTKQADAATWFLRFADSIDQELKEGSTW